MKYEITYSRTVRPANFESIRIELSKEFEEEETPVDAGFFEVKSFVLKRIEEDLAEYKPVEHVTYVKREVVPPKPKPKVEGPPLFYDMPALATLPWTKRNKEPSKPDEWGWVFANQKGTEKLKAILIREGTTHVVIRGEKFICSFSGKIDKKTKLPTLISRRPYKNQRRTG